MKNKEKKALKAKLLMAMKKVLSDNKASLNKKSEKSLEKLTSKIVKRTIKDRSSVSKATAKKVLVHRSKLRANGISALHPVSN